MPELRNVLISGPIWSFSEKNVLMPFLVFFGDFNISSIKKNFHRNSFKRARWTSNFTIPAKKSSEIANTGCPKNIAPTMQCHIFKSIKIWRLQIFYSKLAWIEIVYWKIWCDYLIPLKFCSQPRKDTQNYEQDSFNH